jgi:pyruvate/2-oxoglutarate/acetoin dehydrogenase E1 component
MYMNCPGLKIILPATPYDIKGLLKTAIRDNSPVICFEHMALGAMEGEVPEEEYTLPFGQAVIRREGTDVTVVALAKMVHDTLAVAEELAREGISIEIIDPRTLNPLDKKTIRDSVAKTGRLVVVDEACMTAGAAAEFTAFVVEDPQVFSRLKSSPKRVCGRDVPIPYSPPMERYALPSREQIKTVIREVMT